MNVVDGREADPNESQETIEQHVRVHARTRPDELAVIAPGGQLTWAELDRSADQFAGMLESRGVQPGDRVGWLGRNDLWFLPVLLGTRRRRAALVGLNWRLTDAQVADCTASVDASLVVADPEFAAGPRLRQVTGERLVVLPGAEGQAPWSSHEPSASLPAEPDDVSMLYFTSGSTGAPKAVYYQAPSFENFVAAPLPFPFNESSRLLIIPPVFHLAGSVWAQYGLMSGGTQVYIEDASPTGIVDALAQHRITHAQMVPTLMQAMMSRLHATNTTLPDLRNICYGTAPIAPVLLRDLLSTLDCRFTQVYGLSEAGGVLTYLEPEEHVVGNPRLLSVGRPMPGVTVRIVDVAAHQDLEPTVSGEVVVRTPYLMTGYWGRPDATAESIRDGWLYTRDAGRLDVDGFLYLDGRVDDTIITGGENVHPVAVEAVLADMPGVAECAVFGMPDATWGERVWAAVVLDDASIDEAAVIAHCREHLARYQCPSRVMIVEDLPRNATGKLQRKTLKQEAEQVATTVQSDH